MITSDFFSMTIIYYAIKKENYCNENILLYAFFFISKVVNAMCIYNMKGLQQNNVSQIFNENFVDTSE